MNPARIHRFCAILVASYVLLHMANHLAMLSSVASHMAVMSVLRRLYRPPLLEAILLFSVVVQVLSGAWRVVRGWRERSGSIAWWQAGSGAYMVFFLAAHVSAVLLGRVTRQLDTNFWFVAADLHSVTHRYWFALFYFLAVAAVFTHLSCAAYWFIASRSEVLARRVFRGGALAGVVVAALLVLTMAGRLYPVEVPPEYLAPAATPQERA